MKSVIYKINRTMSGERILGLSPHVLALVLLFLANYCINYVPEMTGANFMDDLSYYTLYTTTPAKEFIFNLSSNKFRPVFHLVMLFVYRIVGYNAGLLQPILILFNYLVVSAMYYICLRLSGSKIVGFLLSCCYIFSRFALYQVTQVHGIMESMAQILALFVLYFLFEYIKREEEVSARRKFLLACIFYILCSFVHERYMLLGVLLPVAIFLRSIWYGQPFFSKPNVSSIVVGVAVPVAVVGTRFAILGRGSLDGTGGVNILDSFDFLVAVKTAISQVLWIFGITKEPPYMSGATFADAPRSVVSMTVLYCISILVIFILWVLQIVWEKNRITRKRNIIGIILFPLFIGICIVSSSVTFRLEMRWIYVSLSGTLAMLAYCIGQIRKNASKKQIIATLLAVTIMTGSFFHQEQFYRHYWIHTYMWSSIIFTSSLKEEVMDVYEDVNSRELLFVLNFEGADESSAQYIYTTAKLYFAQFDLHPKIDVVLLQSDIQPEQIGSQTVILLGLNYSTQYVNISRVEALYDASLKELLLRQN